ncbi:MAG TPA: Ig-like domain-containing protein [Allosphingosinicella sp.]|jgi:hypothetical protein
MSAGNILTIVSGNDQACGRGNDNVTVGGVATFGALMVKLSDAAGRPLGGQPVRFRVAEATAGMNCMLTADGASEATVAAFGDGTALLHLRGGYGVQVSGASGSLTVVAEAEGAEPVAFALSVSPSKIAIVSGNGQTQPRVIRADGIAVARFEPLVVQVRDAYGTPLRDVKVTWSADGPGWMARDLDPYGSKQVATRTDDRGFATLNAMFGSSAWVYYADGYFSVAARSDDALVTFDMMVGGALPAANLLAIVGGDGQQVPRVGEHPPGGIATFAPLAVRLTDPSGAPLPGREVVFREGDPNSPMACQMSPNSGGGFRARTDGDGVAILDGMGGNSINAYYASGPMPVVAGADNSNLVTFALSVL